MVLPSTPIRRGPSTRLASCAISLPRLCSSEYGPGLVSDQIRLIASYQTVPDYSYQVFITRVESGERAVLLIDFIVFVYFGMVVITRAPITPPLEGSISNDRQF